MRNIEEREKSKGESYPAQNLSWTLWRCHGTMKCGRRSFQSHPMGQESTVGTESSPSHIFFETIIFLLTSCGRQLSAVWRASKSQEKGRTVCAMLGLCMERQSGGSRGTSTCLESGSPTVYQLWCTELTTCPWWVILFDRWVKLQCCVIRS